MGPPNVNNAQIEKPSFKVTPSGFNDARVGGRDIRVMLKLCHEPLEELSCYHLIWTDCEGAHVEGILGTRFWTC